MDNEKKGTIKEGYGVEKILVYRAGRYKVTVQDSIQRTICKHDIRKKLI